MYDYSRIRGKIKEQFRTQEAFARALGISTASLSDKLNNKKEWTQTEMLKVTQLFKVAQNQIPVYFFYNNTQEPELDAKTMQRR